MRASITQCPQGHAYTDENTCHRKNGSRYCRTCHNDRARNFYQENAGVYIRAYRKRNPELKTTAQYNHRLRTYGLTPEKYQEMFDKQGGMCALAVCGRPIGCVDHDHLTEEVRELLCKKCNSGIGMLNDNPALVQAAADYLRRHV